MKQVPVGQVNSDRLEKLQLEAARIVTGLTCYTSLDSIYRETGWGKLSTRREVKQLCMFYKLNVGNSPEFLCDLIPPSVGELTTIIYEIVIILVKLQTYYRYPNSHFFVDDQVMEFIRPENTSTFNF